MLNYELDSKQFKMKVGDLADKEERQQLIDEHQSLVKTNVDTNKIVFKGEVLDDERMFFVFNGRDETEPHSFLMNDPLYLQGIIADWTIRELDFVHKERDDELVVRRCRSLGHLHPC